MDKSYRGRGHLILEGRQVECTYTLQGPAPERGRGHGVITADMVSIGDAIDASGKVYVRMSNGVRFQITMVSHSSGSSSGRYVLSSGFLDI